jgi:hypothetical protein
VAAGSARTTTLTIRTKPTSAATDPSATRTRFWRPADPGAVRSAVRRRHSDPSRMGISKYV